MYNSIKKIVYLNPINKIYGDVTHHKTGFICPDTIQGVGVLYAFDIEGTTVLLVAGNSGTIQPTEDYKVYVDGTEVEIIGENIAQIEYAEMLAEINFSLEYIGLPTLDETYIGGWFLSGNISPESLPSIPGTYLLVFDDVNFYAEGEITINYPAPTYDENLYNEEDLIQGYRYNRNGDQSIYYEVVENYSNTPNFRGDEGDVIVVACSADTMVQLNCFVNEQVDPESDLPFYVSSYASGPGTEIDITLPVGTKYFTIGMTSSNVTKMNTITLTQSE